MPFFLYFVPIKLSFIIFVYQFYFLLIFVFPILNQHLSSIFFIFLFADVTVKYIRGLPHVTVPLPSRDEKCQFVLRPVSHNVGDFIQMLRAEDRGIDRATVANKDGVRIAAACSIENLMDEDFW